MAEFRSYPKRRKDSEEPVFLRKTFVMLGESPTEIVSWTSDGLSFVVNNADKFAEHIIPRYFKHNNMASFVRQLNFYGFRKVKHSRTITVDVDVIEFKHPQFQRDRPDLLMDIKRAANNNDMPDQNEFNNMKRQVHVMHDRMEEMARTIDDLTSLIKSYGLIKEEPASKRAKMEPIVIYDSNDEMQEQFDQDTMDMLADFDTSYSEQNNGGLNNSSMSSSVIHQQPSSNPVTNMDVSSTTPSSDKYSKLSDVSVNDPMSSQQISPSSTVPVVAGGIATAVIGQNYSNPNIANASLMTLLTIIAHNGHVEASTTSSSSIDSVRI